MARNDDDVLEEAPATLELADSERAEILRRRRAFVARALGGLAVPALVAGCSDPQPCLNIAQPRGLVPTSTADASSASSTASASAAPTTAPAADGAFAISSEEAHKLGLPAVGFRATMKRGGWSVSGPSKDQYVSASGPPGGPLTFLAKPYNDGVSDQAAIEVLFRKALSGWSGLDPIEVGPAEQVTIGGRKLEAQAFRTGKGLATTSWCVVKAPLAPDARNGILFLFGTGTGEGARPSCKASLEHAALAEIVATLTFLE